MTKIPPEKIQVKPKINYFRILKPRPLPVEDKFRQPPVKKIKGDQDVNRLSLSQPLILSAKDQIPQSPNLFVKSTRKIPEAIRELSKPPLPKNILSHKSEIKFSDLEIEPQDKLSQTPAYLTYSSLLRERIRRCLYNKLWNINAQGIVCLRFALDVRGQLLEYFIVEEKTKANDKLRAAAINGLKEALPFPPLPKELNSPSATFSVIIHFISEE